MPFRWGSVRFLQPAAAGANERNMLAFLHRFLTVSVVCLSAAAQGVVTVTPGQSIQAAVNTAVDGTVIVVSPGSYAPFTINGKSIAVVCASVPPAAWFTVVPAAGQPVRVTGLAAAQTVTIGNMITDHTVTSNPAILVDGNAGAVRLKNVIVRAPQALPSAQFEGLIEARSTSSLLLENVTCGNNATVGDSATSAHAQNALCGLYVIASVAKLAAMSDMRGLASPSPAQRGGDGIRLDTGSELWMVRSTAQGGNPPAGGGTGGFGLHDIAGPSASIQLDSVSSLNANSAPPFGLNNSGATAPFMPAVDQAELDDTRFGRDSGLSLGEVIGMRTFASVGDRGFSLFLGLNGGDIGPALLSLILGARVTGREDIGIFSVGNPFVTVASGVLPPGANVGSTFQVTMSSDPTFLGAQVTFQSLLLSPQGSPVGFAFSSSRCYVMR